MDFHPSFELTASRNFPDWLSGVNGSLAFSTYEGGKMFLLGVRANGELSVFERDFPRCMGIGVSNGGRTLHLATRIQILRFDNFLASDQSVDSYDAVFSPTQSWFTGDVDAHDVAVDNSGMPLFASTAFNCVSSLKEGQSFRRVWQPKFISGFAAEDRCHLNGIALEKGELAYVTCVSTSNCSEGWRDFKRDGGVVVDTRKNQIVADNMSMPHSPRMHRGKLWVLNSGTGEFGYVDLNIRKFISVNFCPGYARGLALVDRFAVIGLSRPRRGNLFRGLDLDRQLNLRQTQARCGLIVVDLRSGDIVEWVRIEGPFSELYDVAFIPNILCPSAIGIKGKAIERTLSISSD